MPGCDLQGGISVHSESSRNRDGWGRGVDDLKSRWIDGGGETERLDGLVLSTAAPADPHVDFAFNLEGTTHNDDPKTISEPSASDAARIDHPSTSETLRRLESAMGLPEGAGTTVELIPMDFDTTPSASTPQFFASGEGGTQCWGRLPFQSSSSKFPALVPSPLLSSTITSARELASTGLDLSSLSEAPVEVRPRTPRVSVAVSGSGPTLGSVESVSALADPDSAEMRERIFSGPSLFLGDDGME